MEPMRVSYKLSLGAPASGKAQTRFKLSHCVYLIPLGYDERGPHDHVTVPLSASLLSFSQRENVSVPEPSSLIVIFAGLFLPKLPNSRPSVWESNVSPTTASGAGAYVPGPAIGTSIPRLNSCPPVLPPLMSKCPSFWWIT